MSISQRLAAQGAGCLLLAFEAAMSALFLESWPLEAVALGLLWMAPVQFALGAWFARIERQP
jgi:hypothetical protein